MACDIAPGRAVATGLVCKGEGRAASDDRRGVWHGEMAGSHQHGMRSAAVGMDARHAGTRVATGVELIVDDNVHVSTYSAVTINHIARLGSESLGEVALEEFDPRILCLSASLPL